MAKSAKRPAEIVELLRSNVVGKKIRALDVYGINSLKTQSPPLAELSGLEVVDVQHRGDAVIALSLTGVDVVVDLQRAAVAQFAPQLDAWAYGRGPQPTVRLLLADGSGVDLKEPSKTKRIAVRLLPTN